MPSSGARSDDSTFARCTAPASSTPKQSVNVPPRSMKKSKASASQRLVQEARVRHALGIDTAQIEGDRAILGAHDHVAAVLELAEQELVTERLLDLVLDQSAEGTCAVRFVVALLRQVGAGGLGELDGDLALCELVAELSDELVHHAAHYRRRQRIEGDTCVEPIAELRAEGVAEGEGD